ncbi:MAG: caspase family protein [Pirellulaceae bacterium]
MRIVSERDAYVYVIYQQADGQAYQVFPNVAQRNNRVTAKQVVEIPAKDDQFRWTISGPFGNETVKVIASEKPIAKLSDEHMKSKRFNAITKNAMASVAKTLLQTSPATNKAIDSEAGAESDTEPATWAETELTVTTYERNRALEASGAKRFAVFFGVSAYQFSEQEKLITEHSPNLSSPQNDAMLLDKAMHLIGDITESKVYINDAATRSNMEKMITQWLPQVSRPGDTVFIYFSGHGGQIPDDSGDEVDKKDEILIPYDYMGLPAFLGLIEQEKAGTITAENKAKIPAVRQLLRGIDSAEKAHHRLSRQTGVSDDLFGHWLQSLNGRQVVVILDICHSGGFVTNEKSIFDSGSITRVDPTRQAAPQAGDFLDQEITRLKDIGQGNTAVMTASATAEYSLVRPDGNLSVMTHELIMALTQARGPQNVENVYARVAQQCKVFFDSPEFKAWQQGHEEEIQPHHPLLYKPTAIPIWFKP